jgi:hypothetical protein
MFILEPFIKHEEEQQAYARLHRYGQEGSGVQDLLHARFCGVSSLGMEKASDRPGDGR